VAYSVVRTDNKDWGVILRVVMEEVQTHPRDMVHTAAAWKGVDVDNRDCDGPVPVPAPDADADADGPVSVEGVEVVVAWDNLLDHHHHHHYHRRDSRGCYWAVHTATSEQLCYSHHFETYGFESYLDHDPYYLYPYPYL
jgi:hypothetical protein